MQTNMNFKTQEIGKEITCDELISHWADDDITENEMSIELEWLKNTQADNYKYTIYDANDKKYPIVYEITSVGDRYLKTLKIKHAPYMLEKFYESMNFEYLTALYKRLIEDIIEHSNKKGIRDFRIYIDNDNTIAVLAFQLFAQLLLPDNYKSKFSSCKRWLFVKKL